MLLNISWLNLVVVATLAVCVAIISMTITQALIFKSFREWVKSKSNFLGDLLSCPYCTSHWVSAVFGILVMPRVVITSSIVLDVIISVFLMIAFAAPWCKVIYWAYMNDDYGDEE